MRAARTLTVEGITGAPREEPWPGLHITWGPRHVLKTEPAGDRWCFAQRKRLPHEWRLMGDEGPSYYEPVWICICLGCGKDRTRFGDGW